MNAESTKPVKCDKCGVETKIEAAFHKIESPHTSRVTRRCPKCWLKFHSAAYKRTYFAYVVVCVLGVGLVLADPKDAFGWMLLNFMLYYLLWIPAALPHELGHAFAAKVLGFRVFQVTIGFGKTIFERSFCGFDFQINSIPVGGFAFSTPKNTRYYRKKQSLMILAGPMANLLVAGLLVFLAPERSLDFDFFTGLRLASVFLITNLMCAAYSLWPRKFNTERGQVANDGLLLWQTLLLPKESIQTAPVYYYLHEGGQFLKNRQFQAAKEWFEKGLILFPSNLNLLNALGTTFTYSRNYEEAREIYLKLLSRPNTHEYYRTMFANNLAYLDTLIGGEELIQEADKYSREAFENMPSVSYFRGTRGCVLVELGKFEEGIALLKDAMEQTNDTRSKALNACHVAIAEKRRGNARESDKFTTLARSLDPECMLLDKLK
jgi:hypothetical protein